MIRLFSGIKISFCLFLIFQALPLAATELNFFEALDRILIRDPNLKGQDALNKAELLTLDADRKSAYPTLNASVVHAINRPWNEGSWPRSDYWRADLGLNIYRFGQDGARYRLAERGTNRYAAAAERQTLDAEKAASDKILIYIFNRLDLAVLEKIRAVRQRLLDVSSKQYGRGLLPVQEVKKVELDLRSIDLQIKRALVLVEQSRFEVERYLATDDVKVEWPVIRAPAALSSIENEGKHPLLTEAQEALAMEREQETVLWASQYPSVDAQALTYRSMSGDPFDEGHSEFLLSVTVPILDRGLSRSLYRAQGERSNAAASNLEALRQTIDVQKKSAKVALTESISNIEVYEDLTVTAKQLYQDSLGRFERGLITVNDLSVDEARYYTAERERVQSWYTLQTSWVMACQSSGLRLKACLSAS